VRFGLTVSLLLHVVILVWGLVSFASPRKVVTPKITPISVSFVTAADFDKVRKGARDSKLKTAAAKLKKKPLKATKKKSKPKPKLAAAKPVVEPPPPKPKAKSKPKAKVPPLKPTIDPVAKKLAELAKKPKPKPKAKPKPKPKPKAKLKPKPKPKKVVRKRKKKKKKKTFAEQMTALLDKTPDKSAPRAASKPKVKRKKRVGPRAGAFDGRAEQLAINQIAGVMQAKMRECWRLPTGGVGADQMIVTVRVRLRRDGLLAAYPEVQNTSSSPFFRIAAESVKRALKACEPYDLPPDKYDIWRDMDLAFDPSAMYGL
jgi:colicin import membrane protein